MILFILLNIVSAFLVAQEPEIAHHYVGQLIYHNGKEYMVTAYENLFPFNTEKEYIEATITAERPVKLFGIEFAKDTLHKSIKRGKNPNTGAVTITENSIISRSYALKSYIIGILFAYSLSKSLISEMYPPTYIINRI